jgi:hypothetical protein
VVCEMTLRETAIEPASTSVVTAASPPRESASQAGPMAIAVADAVGGSQRSADSGPTSGAAAPVQALSRLPVRASDQGFLPIQVEHYLMLLDWTGRELRADKRGAIPDHLAPILDRLGLNRSNWVETLRGFGRLFNAGIRNGVTCLIRPHFSLTNRRFFADFAAVEVQDLRAN